MRKVRIIVVCGSGVATSMHAAYTLRDRLQQANIEFVIDGGGNNELPYRYKNYDIIVSNSQVSFDPEIPVFNAVPLLTGIGEEELIQNIIEAAKEIAGRED